MKFALTLLAFVPSISGLKFDLPIEYEKCDPDVGCTRGFECFDLNNKGNFKAREKYDNRNQCCLPRGTWECEEGECCEGSYCKPYMSSTRCVPGPDPKGLYNGLCDPGTPLEADYHENNCAPLFNNCDEAGGQSNCCDGFTCKYSNNRNKFPAKCVVDKTIDKSCCKATGTKNCSPGECCIGSYCQMTSAGWTQCRNGLDPFGEYDGVCNPSDRFRDCKAYRSECSASSECCDGFHCVDGTDGSRCEADPKHRTHCAMQNYEMGCEKGDCQLGFHCFRPGTKKAQCQPGPEDDYSHNGLCPSTEVVADDEWKNVCGYPENACSILDGQAEGDQGTCCDGFVCSGGMCAEDPDLDDKCCTRNGLDGCSPGDCCFGTHCVVGEWKSYCRPGVEESGVTDGLCDNNEPLLECRGTVGEVWGDPHVETYNGFRYSCMGRGEFIVTRSQDTYFEVQGRFLALDNPKYDEYTSSRAYVVAASLDDEFPNIQVNFADEAEDNTFSFQRCSAQLWIGGVLQDIDNIELTGDPDVTVTWTGWSVEIQYGASKSYAAVEIRVTGDPTYEYGCMMNAFICLPIDDPGLNSDVVGLLGTPNKSKHDDWMTLEGEHVEISYDEEEQYDYCTKNWCIREEQVSHFVYGMGDSFDTYEDCGGDFPGQIVVDDVPDHVRVACKNDVICMQEWVIGGDDLADETRRNEEKIDDVKDPVRIGNAPSFQTEAPTDEDGDDVCIDDIKLIATSGETPVAVPPLRIVSQTRESVTLKLLYPYDNEPNDETVIDYIYHQYAKVDEQCELNTDVEQGWSTEFTVDCWEETPISIVRIYVADSTQVLPTDAAEIAECCHHPDDVDFPVVEYVFEVACEPQCP